MLVRKTSRPTVSAETISSDHAPTFPEWLQLYPTVKAEAERILYTGRLADDALVLRLATDKRMKTVWGELSKYKSSTPHLSKAWAILNKVYVKAPQDSDPLALFFWVAYAIASLKFTAETFPQADVPIAQYNLQAARLRESAAMLRYLNLKHSQDIDFGVHIIKEIEEAADFCDWLVILFTQVRAARAPLLVKRNQGNMEARGFVRMLAVETRNLFGKTLYGTLATVASVALDKDITDAQVNKWCIERKRN